MTTKTFQTVHTRSMLFDLSLDAPTSITLMSKEITDTTMAGTETYSQNYIQHTIYVIAPKGNSLITFTNGAM